MHLDHVALTWPNLRNDAEKMLSGFLIPTFSDRIKNKPLPLSPLSHDIVHFFIAYFGIVFHTTLWNKVDFLNCGRPVNSCRHWHTIMFSEQRYCLKMCALSSQICRHRLQNIRYWYPICNTLQLITWYIKLCFQFWWIIAYVWLFTNYSRPVMPKLFLYAYRLNESTTDAMVEERNNFMTHRNHLFWIRLTFRFMGLHQTADQSTLLLSIYVFS